MYNIFRFPRNSLFYVSKNAFASKMQAGSTQKTKDSAGRRLGVKKFGGQEVFPNDILVRQRGFKWHPGKNTVHGKDHTIHSKVEGIVEFEKDPWRKKKKYYVNVIPQENPNRFSLKPPPFCYHPELFPELAKSNPEPFEYERKVRKSKKNKEKRTDWFGIECKEQTYKRNVFIPESYLKRFEKEDLVEIEEIEE